MHRFPPGFLLFEVDLLTDRIAIENQLRIENTGKQILCIFPWLEIGGADKFNLDLVTLLTNRDYHISIVTTLKSAHPWRDCFDRIAPNIFHLPDLLGDCHWLAFIRYLIESRHIDLVFISNSYIAYYFLPLLRSEFPSVAFVDYTHGDDPGWRGSGYPRVSCQFTKFLDYQIVASGYLSKFYQKIDAKTKDKLKICHINVDTNTWIFNPDRREEIRSKLGISADCISILFPARIVNEKRPLFFIDIISQLVSNSLPVSAIVLGEGYLLPDMQAKIDRLNLNAFVQILPPVDSAQMLDFYSASDILLLPSEYEGISLSIYEAMSMQLPVVAADVGGQSELLTIGTGFLIPKGRGDALEVAEYLQVLMPLIKNPQLRQQVGTLARQRVVTSFSLESMCDRVEAIFDEAIQLRQVNPPISVDRHLAAESLTIALEYLHQDLLLADLWREKCQVEVDRTKLIGENHQQEIALADLWREKCQVEVDRTKLIGENHQQEIALADLWREKCQVEVDRTKLIGENHQQEIALANLWREKCQVEVDRTKLIGENHQQEIALADLWREKCQVERERDEISQEKHLIEQERAKISQERDVLSQEKGELWEQKNAMETSKFWKMRDLWFKVKQKIFPIDTRD